MVNLSLSNCPRPEDQPPAGLALLCMGRVPIPRNLLVALMAMSAQDLQAYYVLLIHLPSIHFILICRIA